MRLGVPFLPVLALLAATSCVPGAGDEPVPPSGLHEEASDFVVVGSDGHKADSFAPTFDRNRVLTEGFFLASGVVDGDAVQAFLEHTPYDTRCWLADEKVSGIRAADAVVNAARTAGLNPIVLLARMQVEKSLIGKTVRPSQNAIDYAFGCGCPDGSACDPKYRGLDKQIACAVATLRNLHDASKDGTGQWRAGHTRKTFDGLKVTPFNHATAALYGYTPWVLPGVGGNWLVWNVTRKFAFAFEEAGAIDLADPALDDPWTGSPCTDQDQCPFESGAEEGFCFVYAVGEDKAGFCSVGCEGYCEDRAGRDPTFCVSVDGEFGFCAVKSAESNGFCSRYPGTAPVEKDRFVGTSGAPLVSANVCLP
jgi:hypothetical protein